MLVLVILGLIWGFVLIPPICRVDESRPGDSIASFRQQLNVLERTTPGDRSSNLARLDVGRYDVPATTTWQRRPSWPVGRRPPPCGGRRAAVTGTTCSSPCSVPSASPYCSRWPSVAPSGCSTWIVDVAFVAYVAMLVSLQQQSMEQQQKVRYMPPTATRRPAPTQLVVRRYGS